MTVLSKWHIYVKQMSMIMYGRKLYIADKKPMDSVQQFEFVEWRLHVDWSFMTRHVHNSKSLLPITTHTPFPAFSESIMTYLWASGRSITGYEELATHTKFWLPTQNHPHKWGWQPPSPARRNFLVEKVLQLFWSWYSWLVAQNTISTLPRMLLNH